jgi:hypothetical protein
MSSPWINLLTEGYLMPSSVPSSNTLGQAYREPSSRCPQPSGLLQPLGLLHGHDNEAEVDVSAILKLNKHLIFILRKIKPRMDLRGNVDGDGCAGAIVAKMQNTLLRGLFGDDEAFQDSLGRPSEMESTDDPEDATAHSIEDMTPEWFIGEVWNNVGWDILAKRID